MTSLTFISDTNLEALYFLIYILTELVVKNMFNKIIIAYVTILLLLLFLKFSKTENNIPCTGE